jgi:hypothetical protein
MERLPERQPQEKKTMDEPQNPIDKLVAKFSRASGFEVTRVRGFVDQVDTLAEGDRKIYIVHVSNGPLKNSFWLEHDRVTPGFHAPRQGDLVSGMVNTFDDSVEFLGETHKPIFDFRHRTAESEESAFDWFAKNGERVAREAAQRRLTEQSSPPLDDKSRDTLYRKLGLRPN